MLFAGRRSPPLHPDDAVSAHALPVTMVFHPGIPMHDLAADGEYPDWYHPAHE